MKIHLRARPLKQAGKDRKPDQSLFLDYSPPLILPGGKKKRWQSLGLYLYSKPRNPHERQHNREVKDLAEKIRRDKETEVLYGRFSAQASQKALLVDFLRKEAATRKPQTERQWSYMINHIELCGIGGIPLKDLDIHACVHFRNYLLKLKRKGKLSDNTSCNYMRYFRTGLRAAFRTELVKENLVDRFDPLSPGKTDRVFLTMQELRLLARTPIRSKVRKIGLFSAMTGLRYSDIKALKWEHVRDEEDGCYLVYRQVKKSKPVRKPINREARELLGERGRGPVFPEIICPSSANEASQKWLQRAGIEKPGFTFHSFRHTFATSMLAVTGNIKAVQEALDHDDIRTTQIYAKVLQETVRKAVDEMQFDLGAGSA
ncbi:hypothetical protein CR161_03715 [Prosthecochloris sp. ZM]|uniref:site-specific integrase n=1 Tax=Prosthecochloris sp. ZM TaxID=2283143 RepID=UPI000DF7EF70|nr:site-specific integrase [Prosthecochloris sp. ZM]RDD29886.1 hypothetical protein CR161_03715 [Prosthecochloris sp. ZM]